MLSKRWMLGLKAVFVVKRIILKETQPWFTSQIQEILNEFDDWYSLKKHITNEGRIDSKNE